MFVVATVVDAVVIGVVDNAAVVESVVILACGGTATAADKGSCGVEVAIKVDDDSVEEAIIENWPIEAAEVVAATGGGIVCSMVFWTAGAGATWAIEVVVESRDVENVLVVLVCVLMSVLGNAVHLLPCSVVMKAPRGRFGLVAMAKEVGVYHVRFQSL